MVISSVQSKNLRVIEPVDGGDGKYVAVSPDDETYGVNAGAILREVMGPRISRRRFRINWMNSASI